MNLENKTIEELIGIAHYEFQFGRTINFEANSEYLACSYYSAIEDYSDDSDGPMPSVPTFNGPALYSVCMQAAEWTLNNTRS